MMMVKMTKQNEGDNGNVLTTLELNDATDKAPSNDPYQGAHENMYSSFSPFLLVQVVDGNVLYWNVMRIIFLSCYLFNSGQVISGIYFI
jgi:uncharacterized MAPEG superfamily protein